MIIHCSFGRILFPSMLATMSLSPPTIRNVLPISKFYFVVAVCCDLGCPCFVVFLYVFFFASKLMVSSIIHFNLNGI